MRKIYSLIASALLMLPAALNAQTMTDENETLTGMGYRLEKDVNFREGKVGDKDIVPNNSLQFGAVENFKINGNEVNKLTNEGLEFMSIQLPGNGIALVEGTGLRSTSNERWIVVNDLRVGQILAFDISNTDPASFVANSVECNSKTSWADNFVDPLIVEEISGDIHSLQELGGGEDGTSAADTYRYYKVINEGSMYAKFNGKSPSNTIYRMQIWSSTDEAEVVSAPSLKVIGVNNENRTVALKEGVSTYGNPVVTYYSVDGSDPIFLTDSKEIDHYEYVYETDEEGNTVLDENGEPIVKEEIPHYKKVLDEEMVELMGGLFGEEIFESGTSVFIKESDANGTGVVTVKAASVSESTHVCSEIVELQVPVGSITLNGPTISLFGFDGTVRQYTVGWVNNTLCEEEVTISAEFDDGTEYREEVRPGDVISFEKDVKFTVTASGYENGTAYMEADYPGIDIHRKYDAKDEDGNEIHDWDFTSLTQEQQDIVMGKVIGSWILVDEVTGDTIATCTNDEYLDGNGQVGEYDFTNGGQPVYAYTSWWWDGGNQRATLNVDTLGNNMNANNMGYVEDIANIFPGIAINCPPNANNASTIFIYIGRNNNDGKPLGAYFMSRPELFTFSRERVKAGEFIYIMAGAGGSNYTNGRSPFIKQVPADEFLTVTGRELPYSNGVHIFYIDVYTYDDLPEDLLGDNADDAWEDVVAIEGVKAAGKAVVGVYTVSGAKLSAPQKGINIVKYSDGTAAKVLVK